jgi:dihydrofolate reductase
MRVSMIVAASEHGIIGRAGRLPWKIPSDLRRFKSLTMGHAYIVGRKTFDEVGKPLPGRKMIVVSRGAKLPHAVVTVPTIEAAFAEAERLEPDRNGEGEIFVGGGAQLFALALPRIERIYLTRVHGEVQGDVRVPFLDVDPGGVPPGFEPIAPPEALDEIGATHRATFHVYSRPSHG